MWGWCNSSLEVQGGKGNALAGKPSAQSQDSCLGKLFLAGGMHKTGSPDDASEVCRNFFKDAPHPNDVRVFNGRPFATQTKVPEEERREFITEVAMTATAPGPIDFHTERANRERARS
jgi:hypothetical protein